MQRLGEVDRGIAVAGGADELRAISSRKQQLEPLRGQRLDARWGSRANCRYGPMTGGGYKVVLTMPVETNARG